MDKKEFLKAVQACRRKMNIALFMEKTVSALSIGAAAGILFQAAAFLFPFIMLVSMQGWRCFLHF